MSAPPSSPALLRTPCAAPGTPSSILKRGTLSAAAVNAGAGTPDAGTPGKRLMFAKQCSVGGLPDKPAPPPPPSSATGSCAASPCGATDFDTPGGVGVGTTNNTPRSATYQGGGAACGSAECRRGHRAMKRALRDLTRKYKDLHAEFEKRGNTILAQGDTLAALADKAAATSAAGASPRASPMKTLSASAGSSASSSAAATAMTPATHPQPLSVTVSGHRLVLDGPRGERRTPQYVEYHVSVNVGSVWSNTRMVRFNELRALRQLLLDVTVRAEEDSVERSCSLLPGSGRGQPDPTAKLVAERMRTLAFPTYGWSTNGCFDEKFIAQRARDMQAWLDDVLCVARRAGKNATIRRVLADWLEVQAVHDEVMWRDDRLRPISSSPTVVAKLATLDSLDRLAQQLE